MRHRVFIEPRSGVTRHMVVVLSDGEPIRITTVAVLLGRRKIRATVVPIQAFCHGCQGSTFGYWPFAKLRHHRLEAVRPIDHSQYFELVSAIQDHNNKHRLTSSENHAVSLQAPDCPLHSTNINIDVRIKIRKQFPWAMNFPKGNKIQI